MDSANIKGISAKALREKQSKKRAEILKYSLEHVTSLLNDIFNKLNQDAERNCENYTMIYELDNKYNETVILEVVDILRSDEYKYSVEIHRNFTCTAIAKLVISW